MSSEIFSDTSNEIDVSDLLTKIFESSIKEADFTDLIKDFSELFDQYKDKGFKQSFRSILKIVLSKRKRSSDIRRILCFISECAITLDNKFKNAHPEKSSEDDEDPIHPVLKYLFKVLSRWSCASNFAVRARSCHLLHMILTYIQDHSVGEIDMNIYETISEIIEIRRLDSSCNVRAEAVLLAKFFQDPSAVNDPLIAGLCWQLENDPNVRVRQNIVSIIAACEETIIPITKRFLFDKSSSVRNAALLHICKRISPRSFTPWQRVIILNKCFFDSSDLVLRNAEQRLIPVWFRSYKDKLCKFLKDLRIGNESLDNLPFINKLVKVLAKCVKISHIIEEIDLDLESGLPKSALTADKVFLWRQFYGFAHKDERHRLLKYIPQHEDLIQYIINCFKNPTFEDDESRVFNELSLFLMEIINAAGKEKCENVFTVLLDMLKNPFVGEGVMAYISTVYLRYSPREREEIHDEMCEIIEDLKKIIQFTPNEEKNILLKCFSIASQVLIEGKFYTSGIRKLKENLIVPNLVSEDLQIQKRAIVAYTLYCEMDRIEAKTSWPFFENVENIDAELKLTVLKGALDILKCHGQIVFCDADCPQEKFDEVLENLILQLEGDEKEVSIVMQGILKIFLDHHTWSSSVLSKVILGYFHPDQVLSSKTDLIDFFQLYQDEKETECLHEAFIKTIDFLFDSSNSSPYHKVSIKSVSLQLLVFSKQGQTSLQDPLKKSFQDMLVLKLGEQFLQKPWRLPAADLYNICKLIIPSHLETLLELRDLIKTVIENLQSAIFQQKNPYSQQSTKFFSSYLKKIQSAIQKTPTILLMPTSPLEKRLFDDGSEDSLDISGGTEVGAALSPQQKSFDSESMTPETVSSPENNSTSQKDLNSLKTPAMRKTSSLATKVMSASRKTPAEKGTLAPEKTPATRKTPAPTKTPAARKAPAPTKTPATRTKNTPATRNICTPSRSNNP